MERRTKIVATIGPASRDPEVLARLVEAGMDVARLNFSHGNHEEHAETARLVREAAGRVGRPVAILQDLPGPKIRIGPIAGDKVVLRGGDVLTFVTDVSGTAQGTAEELTVTWPGLAAALEPGESVYLADGSVRLRVREVRADDGEFDCDIELGGVVASRQGLNVPGATEELPAIPEEDIAHLQAGISIGVDLVALSFVRRPEDVLLVREHTRIPLIAKIEKPQAVARAEDVIRVSDGIMVARGDLGIELPIQEVPLVQKRLLRLSGEHARITITATQMLDSMIRSARPTRAEVADVANAILDGTDAVMLSQETAVGAFPVEAVAMMDSIARTDRARGALLALERAPRAPHGPRPGVHHRPQRRRGRARARARRDRRAHALGPVGAAGLRAPPDDADPRALARQGDRSAAAGSCGACGRRRCASTTSPRS